MIIPYGPDGGINWNQVEREYEWTHRFAADRTYGQSLGEWCVGVVADTIVTRIKRLGDLEARVREHIEE